MRSSPWYHQRRSESAPPAERPREPPSISQKEQEEITDRISRPTESALYRKSLYWKLDSFMDRGFHSWSKMDLFDDCKRCMWTHNGTIKKSSCKIRPIRANLPASTSFSLPPLTERAPASGRSSCSASRMSCAAGNGNGNGNGGGNGDRASTSEGAKRPSASLSTGLAMLGGMNGARYRLHSRARYGHAPANLGRSKAQYPAPIYSQSHPMAVPKVARAAVS